MRKEFICLARLSELKDRPNAELLAIKTPKNLFSDYEVKRYSSRLALETFLKRPGQWNAVIKNQVHKNMLLYPAFQKEE